MISGMDMLIAFVAAAGLYGLSWAIASWKERREHVNAIAVARLQRDFEAWVRDHPGRRSIAHRRRMEASRTGRVDG